MSRITNLFTLQKIFEKAKKEKETLVLTWKYQDVEAMRVINCIENISSLEEDNQTLIITGKYDTGEDKTFSIKLKLFSDEYLDLKIWKIDFKSKGGWGTRVKEEY